MRVYVILKVLHYIYIYIYIIFSKIRVKVNKLDFIIWIEYRNETFNGKQSSKLKNVEWNQTYVIKLWDEIVKLHEKVTRKDVRKVAWKFARKVARKIARKIAESNAKVPWSNAKSNEAILFRIIYLMIIFLNSYIRYFE